MSADIWAIVPVKEIDGAKQRLSDFLSPDQRRILAATMLRDVLRVLVPGGVMVVTFSNRCFPTKAVAIWRGMSGQEQSALVALYLRRAGFAEVQAREVLPGHGSDPLWAVLARKVPAEP